MMTIYTAIIILCIAIATIAFLHDSKISELGDKLAKQHYENLEIRMSIRSLRVGEARSNMVNQIVTQIMNLSISGILTNDIHQKLTGLGLDGLDRASKILKTCTPDISEKEWDEKYGEQVKIFNDVTSEVVATTKLFIQEHRSLAFIANSSTNVSASIAHGEEIDKTKLN